MKMREKCKEKWKKKVKLKRKMTKHVEWRRVREIRQEYIYMVTCLYLVIKFILYLYYIIFIILLYYFIYQKLAWQKKKKRKLNGKNPNILRLKRCVINKINFSIPKSLSMSVVWNIWWISPLGVTLMFTSLFQNEVEWIFLEFFSWWHLQASHWFS